MKKLLHKFLFLIAIVLVASCKNDDPEPVSSPGFIEKFLNDTPSIKVTEEKDTYVSHNGGEYGIYRGYFITPSKDIKITALGCNVPEKGTYELVIGSGANDDFLMEESIYTDHINITDENVFQFKEVNQEIILLANQRYRVAYLVKNSTSYLKARYQFASTNDVSPITHPLMINDIQVAHFFYHYINYDSDKNPHFAHGRVTMSGIFNLPGLVDFKYEFVE